jgi:hypothetical protein
MLRLFLLMVPAFFGWAVLAEEAPQVVTRDRAGAADTVAAATNRAIEELYVQIAEMPLTPRQSVGQVLKELELEEELKKVLRRADQLGAPRWIDEHTCQVQLQITADRVSYGLRQLSAAYPRRFPATPGQIESVARGWPRQVFIATGTSASPKALVEIKPAMSPKWAMVSEVERRRALAAANADASQRAMQSVGPVRLANQKTVGESMQIPAVRQAVQSWLGTRPVTRVDFHEDLQVEVALGVDERDFFSVYRKAISQQPDLPLPREPAEWQRLEREFASHFRPPVGRSSVQVNAAIRPAELVPARAPEWVGQQVEIEGMARSLGPKLRTRYAAEADAQAKLQSRLEDLPLSEGLTVGEAARRDPRLAEAVKRAGRAARIFKTQYNADGSATVHLAADLRDLWEELGRAAGQ